MTSIPYILAADNPIEHIKDVPWRIGGDDVHWMSSQISVMILAALTMPALMHAVAQSERARCASNLKQIGNGLMVYDTQYRGHMPANRPPHAADHGEDDLSALITGAYCNDPGV